MELGYWLSCEEHPPDALVRHAVAAEAAGFRLAVASDHFHPWLPAQGQSPFVWPVLGAIAHATTSIQLATGVSASINRIHPVIIGQAASTLAAMSGGRFILGLGAGERLNEHVTGDPWPRPGIRRRMLREALSILRPLLAGEDVNLEGEFFTVEHAQLFTRAAAPPSIWVAVGGPRTARLAGELADGMIGLEPNAAHVETFAAVGRAGRPVVGQLHICMASSVEDSVATVRRWWPQQALAPVLLSELARPAHFAAAVAGIGDDAVRRAVVCCTGPEPILDAVARFAGVGYTHVVLHQVGPDQDRFLELACREVLPAFV
jgi:coenzyme F420-dependent glucose-6-phosphate dehydrogenase